MSTKKKVLENSFLYIFSSLLIKAINFLLLPIYTYFLLPSDYGIIDLINAFIQVSTIIVAFSLYYSAIRFYTDYKEDKERLKIFYGSIITFVFFSGFIFLTIGLICRKLIIAWFFKGLSFYPIVFIAFLALIFLSLHAMHENILQGMQQGRKLTIINLVFFSLTVLLKLFFIGYMKLGALGVLSAQLILNVLYFLFMIMDLKKHHLFTFQINFEILSEALKYSVPLMPHNLSTHIASFASRIFINSSGTLASVGLYGIAMQFGGIIDLIQVAVNRAFQPWFFEMMNRTTSENRNELVSFSNILLFLYSLIYLGIGLFSQEVIILMTNERYLLSWTIIPVLVIGFSIKSIYYFYVNIIMFYKKAVRKLFIATITGSLAEIILAYLLIPLYGMYGAALAFTFSKLIIVIFVIFISKLYDDVGYRVIKMVSIILPSILFMGLGLYFSYTKFKMGFYWNNFLYKLVILVIYIGFIYFANREIINKNIISGKLLEILRLKREK